MAVKIGNDYLLWVAAPGGSPVYSLFGGQQDGSLDGSREVIDASHKTSGGFALKLAGLGERTINLTYVADLPDTGYTVVETAFKSASGLVLTQIRKGGAAGVAPADVVFAASMMVTGFTINAQLNGTVSGTVSLELAAAPTTDITLA